MNDPLLEPPYVGPRAFRTGERLFGRDREASELANLLIAERVVLLHSPSGAGKTSLIQAGVTPLLEDAGFRLTPPLRVKTPPPEGRQVRNQYVYSVGLDLLQDGVDPHELEQLTLAEVLNRDPEIRRALERRANRVTEAPGSETTPPDGRKPRPRIPVLVFDQLEEILTIDPADWENQMTFFRELGDVLRGPVPALDPADRGDEMASPNGLEEDVPRGAFVWVLLSMREDYMGGLDRFAPLLPGHLQTTYRLDFLEEEAATIAIREPAREHGVAFADEATRELLGDLMVVKVQRAGQGATMIKAPYVQPFQLQVVCRNLWVALGKEAPDGFDAIELDDVQRHADVAGALRSYYAERVLDVAHETGADEGAIRDWFETQLITTEQFRSQTLEGPKSPGSDPMQILSALQEAYLVRSDTRAGATWYELSHDKLIDAVLTDNAEWRRRRLEPWRQAARKWQETRAQSLLLAGRELREAQRWAREAAVTQVEQDFIGASFQAERQRGLLERTQSFVGALGVLSLVELLAIVVLILLLLRKG